MVVNTQMNEQKPRKLPSHINQTKQTVKPAKKCKSMHNQRIGIIKTECTTNDKKRVNHIYWGPLKFGRKSLSRVGVLKLTEAR